MRLRLCLALSVVIISGCRCTLERSTLGATIDGGMRDAFIADASDADDSAVIVADASDAAPEDADSDLDAFVADAGTPDAELDAGIEPDAYVADAGPEDSGPPDSGPMDAGTDAGPPDSGPPDAGGPNLIIRFATRTDPVLLFIETSPASAIRVHLTNASCVGGLRVVGGGVECLYATPLARGTEVRFNFSFSPTYPASDGQWLCNGSSCPDFPSGYVLTYEGAVISTARLTLQRLLDDVPPEELTSFIGVTL